MKIYYIEYNKPIMTSNPNNTACEQLKIELIIPYDGYLPNDPNMGSAINIKTKYYT